jgi:orotidine-5'-phosphate decarboxylase
MQTKDRVILDLDGMPYEDCRALLEKVGKSIYGVKITDLLDNEGPSIFESLHSLGINRVWAGVNLHDTPTTVHNRAKVLAGWGCDMISVHASGGYEMMQEARQGFGPKGEIFAVTALTSLDPLAVLTIYNDSTESVVAKLADQAFSSGCINGLVCSAEEVRTLSSTRKYQGLKFVVQGVRSALVPKNDQQRLQTPKEALNNGANLLVIDRQITLARDPIAVLDLLEKQLSSKA